MNQGEATDTYQTRSAVITRAKLGVAPAELHGSITGFLCAGHDGRVSGLLDSLALEADADDVAAGKNLDDLVARDVTRIHGLLRVGWPIELALPDGPLVARADAVVDWCRGFLGGLGLAGTLAGFVRDTEVAELLAGLEQIATSHLACDDDDEAALDDLLDFIRSAVAHLHAMFAHAGSP